jgi:hypothetical protein
MRAAEHPVRDLDTMPDDPAGTMAACRCDSLYGALETVERMPLPADVNLKRLVVFVTAKLAFGHHNSSNLFFCEFSVGILVPDADLELHKIGDQEGNEGLTRKRRGGGPYQPGRMRRLPFA